MQHDLGGKALCEGATIYGYVRVSTNRQVQGESLQTQKERIGAYVAMRWGSNVAIDFVIEEGESAYKKSTLQRDAFKSLIGIVKQGDVIVSTKLDRVFRNTLDALKTAERLRASGVSLHLMDLNGDVTTNGISGLFFTILAALSQHESSLKSDRIGEVKSSMRARNLFSGGKQEFGFLVKEIDGKKVLISDVVQTSILTRIKVFKTLRDGGEKKYSLDYIDVALQKEFGGTYTIGRSTLHRLLGNGNNNVESRLKRILDVNTF
jgi:DNA invertase Pin-like site-specific DNA recombinase